MRVLLAALLAAVTATLLFPKAIVIDYAARYQWCEFAPLDVLGLLAQDAALAAVVFLGLAWLLRRPSWWRLLLGAAATGTLLAVLLLDARIRQLWFKPLDFALVQYTWANLGDLKGGRGIFFEQAAGFGMTFRRLAAAAGLAFGLQWGAILLGARRLGARHPGAPVSLLGPRTIAAAGLVFAGSIAAATLVPRAPYRMEQNLVTAPLVGLLRGALASDAEEERRAAGFEQKARPLVHEGPRRLFADVKPFENLVVVMLESFRWEGMGFDGKGPAVAPNLLRFGREGVLARCYVSIPHSCKAYYAILTGRHPYPGIEIRESTSGSFPSILSLLRDRRAAHTHALSVMNLLFENTGGILEAAGIEQLRGRSQFEDPDDRSAGAGGGGSTFGGSDGPLYDRTGALLAAGGRPFACVLLPHAAHYPYLYPGKRDPGAIGLADYRKSVTHADSLLPHLIDGMRANDLLRETLFVFVGDHGESFGEHGAFVHNNSLYEEEITVPLVFWSADGRLRHDAVLEGAQIDIAPTIADLFGLEDERVPVQGVSLLRAGRPRPIFVSSFFDEVALALITPPDKYILGVAENRLVRHDLENDPDERVELPIAGDARAGVVERLQAFRAYQRRWRAHEETGGDRP